jgi:hypothetical protein
MPVGGINQTESARIDQVRTEQRRAEETRADEQKQVNQNDREIDDTRRTTESGRGEEVDVNA